MELQKRLDYGFIGYEMPRIPRATRSARRRSVIWRKADDNRMCAFELLASVAGELLLEGPESSPSSKNKSNTSLEKVNVKKEKQNEDGTVLENKEREFFISEVVSLAPVLNSSSSKLTQSQNGIFSGPASVITTSDCSDTIVEQLGNGGSKLERPGLNRTPVEFPVVGDRKVKKPSTLVCSDDSVELTLSRNRIPCGSVPANRDDVKIGSRDDDENPLGCTLRGTSNKAFGPSLRMRDQRIKKILASKYWELNSKSNDKERLDGDVESGLKHQRSLRDYPYKKRKLYDCGSVGSSDGGKSSGGICTSLSRGGYNGAKSSNGLCTTPNNGYNGDASRYCRTLPTAHSTTGPSTFAVDEQASFRPGDPHVKLKIKSFRVPELLIEIPETATIGSLKRTVMEAVTTILGDGLCVGMVFQGKKVGDDKKTLLQTGISHNNKLDALGFTLEPNPSRDPPTLLCSEGHTQRSCDTPRPLKSRYPAACSIAHAVVQAGPANILDDQAGTDLIDFIGNNNHNLAPSRADVSLEKHAADSRTLVAVPAVNLDTFAAVPVRKPKQSEAARRRIRRPFSVTEVESLVQAVEKIGTGRWRDVKLRAFDNAKHRTYVDLKDKWKTLVHTARISPQQRRGEPVPQELLDRVLTAHAYWSQQQARQQMKHHPETCLLL